MKRLLVALALVFGATGVARGQSRPRVELRDSTYVAENVLRYVFDGIVVSSTQRARAQEIIKRAFREQFTPLSGTQEQRLRARDSVNILRNAELRALLSSKRDQALFDRNLAAMTAGTIPARAAPRNAKF